jgi:hypothetical protein
MRFNVAWCVDIEVDAETKAEATTKARAELKRIGYTIDEIVDVDDPMEVYLMEE